jgi:CheY-like chemotaxis protein
MECNKIVVIDDDKDLREALQAILECWGYKVNTAANKCEGHMRIETDRPDLIILDVMMEGWQDGFEMARDLKSDPQWKDMPILMLTGVDRKTGFDFEAAAGDPDWCPVDGFLNKPATPDDLLIEIERILLQ